MASYPPPSNPTGTFNEEYWNSLNYASTTSSNTAGALTQAQANALYLQLAIGGNVQGYSTFPELTATTSLTTPLLTSNANLSITTPSGDTLSINGGKTGGDIDINVGTTDSNINVQTGNLNIENGGLNLTNGNIDVSAPNSSINLNGIMMVNAITFPTGTQTIPYTGGAGNISYTNYNHSPDGTTQTYLLPANRLMDVVFFGRGGTSGTAIEGTNGTPTEGQVAYGGAGGGASCCVIPDIYLQVAQSFTITYNLDNTISVDILGQTFNVNGGGNGTNGTYTGQGSSLVLVAGTGGTGGANTLGVFGFNGVAGANGIVGEYASTYTTQKGFPPSQTNGGGDGGYSTNTGSNINIYLPSNGGCCIISFT